MLFQLSASVSLRSRSAMLADRWRPRLLLMVGPEPIERSHRLAALLRWIWLR